jgi:hypothetical protein
MLEVFFLSTGFVLVAATSGTHQLGPFKLVADIVRKIFNHQHHSTPYFEPPSYPIYAQMSIKL